MTRARDLADSADKDIAGTLTVDALDVDNINVDGNTISSTDTNGDITLDPNGTGDTIIASGNLGVGTSSPGGLAEFYKAGTSEVLIGSDNGGTAQLSLYENNDGTKEGLLKYDGTNNRIHLATSGAANALVIPRDSGNVGINEDSPDTMLHLKDTTANDGPVIRLEGSAQNAANQLIGGVEWKNTDTSGDGPNVTGAVRHYSANSSGSGGYTTFHTHDGAESGEGSDAIERMRLDKNGNLGIGISSPSAKTEISASSGEVLRLTKSTGAYLGFHDGTQTRAALQGINGADGVSFHTGSAVTEHMRLDSTGSLRVGTTTTEGVTNKFTIKFTGGGAQYGMVMRPASAGNTIAQYFVNSAGTNIGSVSLTNSATAYNTGSDYRLKENVADMTGAIARVKQLAPKRFNFIVDTTDTLVDGFIAHEAQTVVPEAVTGTHNEVDDDGNAVMQGIDQAKLVPLLTAALQEAIAKIETLETQRADLETRLTALEAQ